MTAEEDLPTVDLIARHAVLMDAATDAIIVIDEHSTIVDANRAAEQMFGFGRVDLLGMPLRELQAPALRAGHTRAMERYLATGERGVPWNGATVIARDRSGREFPVEISFGEFTERGRRRFLGVIRDLSERIRIETQLRQAKKMEALGLLAGGIAHDFNNLLTAIVCYVDLADAGLDGQHAVRDDLSQIRAAADRATAMTKRLLAFSRREVVQPVVFDPSAALRSLAPLLERLLGAPRDLVIDAPAGRYGIRMDPTQFDRMIINMAVNARDAMPNGGTLSVHATDDAGASSAVETALPATDPRRDLVLTLTDTGTGIAPDTIEHIFDPFFTTKPADTGTGLGLATVHGIVHQAGGSISVDSVVDQGSVFQVRLPLSVAPDAGGPGSTSTHVPDHPAVMVDLRDAAAQAIATRILERAGCRVVAPPDHPTAVEHVVGMEALDVLLTDAHVPAGDGRSVAEAVSAEHPGASIVYVSGGPGGRPGTPRTSDPPGSSLVYPFAPSDLIDLVRERSRRDRDR